MRTLTRAEMRAAEEAAVAGGTSYEQLMENAGRAAAAEMMARMENQSGPRTALLLCGKGNNAGDAFVAGRLLAENGWQVAWLPLCGEDFSPLAAKNLARLPATVRRVSEDGADFAAADFGASLLVDAVFGIGFRGDLPANVREAFRRANAAPGCRVALDLPSGLDCDSGEAAPDSFKAHVTLTFGAAKPGMLAPGGRALCGEMRVQDIGL